MTLLVALIFLASIAVAIWGYRPALHEVSKIYPKQTFNSIHNKIAVDPFVWSKACSPRVRRRYVFSQIAGISGMLCAAYFVWRAAQPNAEAGAGLMVLAAICIACGVAWKVQKFKGR